MKISSNINNVSKKLDANFFDKSLKIKYSPVIQQYLQIKSKYPYMLVFYQMGDFYELFFDDAKKVSFLLKIALTKKKSSDNLYIPMAGVPCHTADYYLSKLISFGESVVICGQTNINEVDKNLIQRKVIKIITPGTVLEESYITESQDNLLASVYQEKEKFGYANLNLSLGCINMSEHENLDSFLSELERTNPKEILCSESFLYHKFIKNVKSIQTRKLWEFDLDTAKQQLHVQFGFYKLKSFDVEKNNLSLCAVGCLFQYIKSLQYISLKHIKFLCVNEKDNIITMNVTTRKNLEISENLNGKEKYTLFSVLNKTVTSMGSRMLKRWLHSPLRDMSLVTIRQKVVTDLLCFYQPVKHLLNKVGDLERMISRVSLNIATPRDFVRMRSTFRILPELNSLLYSINSQYINEMVLSIGVYNHLYILLQRAISDKPSDHLRDGNVIAKGYSLELDKWRNLEKNSLNYLRFMENKERNSLGIKSLKIGYNSRIGYYIQINKNYSHLVPDNYIKKQTLKSCVRYVVPFLKNHEDTILDSKLKVIELEKRLYHELFQIIFPEIIKLQKTALTLSELDVLSNFSERSIALDYVCPILNDQNEIFLEKSRHPVIEFFSDVSFIPNDVKLNKKDKMLLITGPNMGGKSTYMRQIALIIILAWSGSFVPASYARIGCIDKIFTRIGAKDNLYDGQSTFMVEMIETANIMRDATFNSLVLIDELGRGTSIDDAIALAWSCAIYLVQNVKAMILFSTHYLELTKLSKIFSRIKNVYFEAIESDNSVVFMYRLKKGCCKKSYGIFVAELSGLPKMVIQMAKNKLKMLESSNLIR